MTELLGCPFCGGKADWSMGQHGDGSPWRYLACEDCEAMAPNVRYASDNIRASEEETIAAWNTRIRTEQARAALIQRGDPVRADGGCLYCDADQGEIHRENCTKPKRRPAPEWAEKEIQAYRSEQISGEAGARTNYHIVFDGFPAPDGPRFVELENDAGRSISAGEWKLRDDGLTELVIPTVRDEELRKAVRSVIASLKADYSHDDDGYGAAESLERALLQQEGE